MKKSYNDEIGYFGLTEIDNFGCDFIRLYNYKFLISNRMMTDYLMVTVAKKLMCCVYKLYYEI